jgi:hypothetical protein
MTFTAAARTAFCVAALFAVVVAAGRAQSAPSEAGNWKMNVAQSKFSPGPAAKSSTVTISTAGQGVKVVVDGVGPDATKVHWEYTANFDGKPSPVTGNPDGDTVSVKRVNANTVESSYTLKGKPTMVVRRVLSADGKTLTVTQTGTNGQGQKINNVLVFEK